jgi:tetratricopeptide (TPR) repeat protein
LPGELIPYFYFEYLRTREIFRLMPIFHHNAVDILTLACLTAIVPRAFLPPGQVQFAHGAEMVGLARWWRQAEQYENALALLRQALDRDLPDELLFRTMWDVASLEKKLGREHAALPMLTDLAAVRNPWRAAAFTELAKYYEHRERNYAMALEMTRNALELNPSEALRRRAARLEKKR